MPKYTPGPWRVGVYGPNGCYTVGTKKGLMVATVAHSINHPDQAEQAIGDANLIAAAPRMLKALQWFIENDDTNIGQEGNEFWEDGLNEGIAAVAQAIGE